LPTLPIILEIFNATRIVFYTKTTPGQHFARWASLAAYRPGRAAAAAPANSSPRAIGDRV